MTARLWKDRAEIIQILHSAIAQHATKRSAVTSDQSFPSSRNGFSADSVWRIGAEPVYSKTDFSQLLKREDSDPTTPVDSKIYAACLETAEHLMETIQHLDWQLSNAKHILNKYKDIAVAQ